MNTPIFPDAQGGWEELIDKVVDDAEPAIICSPSGKKAVLVPLDEFNSWQETNYLLSSRANAAHLQKSLAEAAAGQAVEKLLDEA